MYAMEITVDNTLSPHPGPCPEGGARKTVYRVAGWCKPAWSVAGDFYDFIELPDSKVAIFVGDVSGKGIAAAAVKTDICTRIHALTLRGYQPTDLLKQLNQEIFGRSQERFVTILYMMLDRRTQEVETACAGHFPPLIRRIDGTVEDLNVESSLPVGVLPATDYAPTRAWLGPDDILCLYTDGVVEAMDGERNQFGKQGLIQALRHSRAHPTDALKSIQHRLDHHVGAAPQHDDATLLCVGSEKDAWCDSAA